MRVARFAPDPRRQTLVENPLDPRRCNSERAGADEHRRPSPWRRPCRKQVAIKRRRGEQHKKNDAGQARQRLKREHKRDRQAVQPKSHKRPILPGRMVKCPRSRRTRDQHWRVQGLQNQGKSARGVTCAPHHRTSTHYNSVELSIDGTAILAATHTRAVKFKSWRSDMAIALSNNAKVGVAAPSTVALLAVGAVTIGAILPPSGGELSGTIAPVERYRSTQVTDADVTLGDDSVPQLMQTDAFHLMVNDPSFRALARDPGFAALAQNPQALAAMARDPQAFAALARDPQAFAALARAAQAGDAQGLDAQARNAEAFTAMAQNAQAFQAMAREPQAFAVMARHPAAFEALARHPQAFAAMARNPQAFQQFARDAQAFQAAARDAQSRVYMARDAAAFEALARDAQAMDALARDAAAFDAMARDAQAFQALARD